MKICLSCGVEYSGRGVKYCSNKCRIEKVGFKPKGAYVFCEICDKKIWRKNYLIKKHTVFYCSKNCLGKDNARRLKNKFKNKKRLWLQGENNHAWKGDNVGYNALHDWIRRHHGKAKVCVVCGSQDNIDWANKSGDYKRDIEDWIQLCRPHHKVYDRENNITRRI